MTRECPWCFGSGKISVDGGSLIYRCPDCAGTGRLYVEDNEDSDSDQKTDQSDFKMWNAEHP